MVFLQVAVFMVWNSISFLFYIFQLGFPRLSMCFPMLVQLVEVWTLLWSVIPFARGSSCLWFLILFLGYIAYFYCILLASRVLHIAPNSGEWAAEVCYGVSFNFPAGAALELQFLFWGWQCKWESINI